MLEKTVYRILSGVTRLKVDGETYLIKSPTPYQKYIAEEIRDELETSYLTEGLLTETELLRWLVNQGFWSDKDEEDIKVMKKNIEEFQVKLFEHGFKGREKDVTKKMIQQSRDKIRSLTEKKHSYDYLSAAGQASIEKNKFLIAMGICDERGNKLLDEFNFLKNTLISFDKIIIAYNNSSISITDYRAIARNEPWRQYWGAKDTCKGLFAGVGTDLTEEQLTLVSWTKLYDSVYQHPKCPVDEVIDDDDMLDGFLIKDRREREADRDKNLVEGILGDKVKNAEEVYVVPQPEHDLTHEKIHNLNSEQTKQILKQRNEFVDKMGKVAQYHLPDVKMKLQMQMNADSMKEG